MTIAEIRKKYLELDKVRTEYNELLDDTELHTDHEKQKRARRLSDTIHSLEQWLMRQAFPHLLACVADDAEVA